MNSAKPLLPSEELLLQQMLQLQFWIRKHPGAEMANQAEEAHLSKMTTLPLQWQLTKDIELRSWQKECVESWFKAGRRGVIKVVTGAGKTILAMAIVEQLQQRYVPDLRVVVVVPTVVLLDQWREELLTHSNLPASAIGLLGGGEDTSLNTDTRIIVSVLNSAARKLPDLVREAAVGASLLLIVDECHRAGAAEMQKVFKTERAFSLGLSATPERDSDYVEEDDLESGLKEEVSVPTHFDDTVLGRELGPVIFELDYAGAIQLGALPPFSILHYGLSLKPDEAVKYEKISREITDLRKELERPGRQGLGLIRWCRSKAGASSPAAGRLLALTGERKRLLFRMTARAEAVLRILRDAFLENPETKAILFHESIDEVMRLFGLLRAEGFAVVAEHSEFPDQMRATSLRLFRDGTAQVIVSARSLIEGFNVPSADIGIIIAASSSVRQRVQTLGRLLRKTKGKDGTEKHAVLHVLYASKTVDELIYEKADWAKFVGAERNRYFVWPDVEKTEPVSVNVAPRSPAPDESSVDDSKLQPGDTYLGNIDQGLGFTRDTQGTITTSEGSFIEPHPELLSLLKHSRKNAGRFRITPARRFVLELEKIEAGWRGVYLGKLSSPVVVLAASTGDLPERDWKPGDSYPINRAWGKTFSVLQRDQRLIAKKVKGGVRFVPPLSEMSDESKRNSVSAIQTFIKSAFNKGHRLSKVVVTKEGHVIYIWDNQAFFVGHAPEGADGFVFES